MPGRPEITGFTKPAIEGDVITLTCTTSGSKPAANIRWFRNDKEVQGKHVVWISQSVVPSVSTCAVPETSLLSNRSAVVLLCAHILTLFHCPEEDDVLGGGRGGFTWCHDLPGSWPTLLLLLEVLRVIPGPAQSCPLPGWGVQVCGCPCVITKSDCRGGKKSINFKSLKKFKSLPK